MIALFIISISFSAYFVGLGRFFPMAFHTFFVNDPLNEKNEKYILRFVKDIITGNTFFFYIAMMLGYILFFSVTCLLLYSWILPGMSAHIVHPAGTIIVLVMIIFGITYIGTEIISKIVFRTDSVLRLQIFYIPALLFFLLFQPLLHIIFKAIPFINRKGTAINTEFLDKGDMQFLFKNPSVGKLKGKYEQELKIFQNTLLFSKIRIRDCMIPRTEVEAIDENTPIEEVRSKFIATGYSKLIVYQENIDNVIGFFNSKDIFKQPETVSEKLSQITFVPETMPANRLLNEFMHDNRSIAVVVDEYGGTSGIVTLEDIMEEIFGDIEDEHDTDDRVEKRIKTNEYIFSGRLEIEYINTNYLLQIPESEDYDTLAGFILYHHQNLPKVNDILKIEQFSIKILKVTNTRIDLILLKTGQD
jgi:CBS domain containing-hemolysin-like protein